MARKSVEPNPPVEDPIKNPEIIEGEIRTMKMVEELSASNTLIEHRRGQLSVSRAVRKVIGISDLLAVSKIKESKSYKGYSYIDDNGNRKDISTFEEYCLVIELRSRQSVDLDLQNLKALGGELFEALAGLGLGPTKMRELRNLSGGSIEGAQALAAEGDSKKLLDMIRDQAVLHDQEKVVLESKLTKEKEVIQGELTEAVATLNSRDRLLRESRENCNKLEEQVSEREHRLSTWDGKVAELNIEITTVTGEVNTLLDILGGLQQKITFLEIEDEHRQVADERLGSNYAAMMLSITRHIGELMRDCDIQFGAYADQPIPNFQQWLPEGAEVETEE